MKNKIITPLKFLFPYIMFALGLLFLGNNPNTLQTDDTPPLFQPNRWCANFPTVPGSGGLLGHASCVLGDTIYLAGGNPSGDASSSFIRYSISGNTWSATTPMLGVKSGGDLVAAGGRIFYIGGGNVTYTSPSMEQYMYDPSTGHWAFIANIPTPVTGNVAEAYQDSLIYCIAGGWDSYLQTVQVYRIRSNSWTTATQLPTGKGRRSFAAGLDGNKIFVACGYSNGFKNDFLIGTINPTNPLSITWTNGPNLVINSSRPGGTAIAGRFYVVLGETTVNQNGSDSMAVWDTTTASWSYFDGKPLRASNYWGVVSASKVYCAGRPGVKVWIPGGVYNSTTVRPLDVFTDTCMTGCLTTLTGIEPQVNTLPDKFELMQNYPNPFNPSTSISFALPRAEHVKLVIYNVLGNEISVLVNESRNAGRYSVSFDGTNLPSGIYFCRLEAGDFKDVKKMMLIK